MANAIRLHFEQSGTTQKASLLSEDGAQGIPLPEIKAMYWDHDSLRVDFIDKSSMIVLIENVISPDYKFL